MTRGDKPKGLLPARRVHLYSMLSAQKCWDAYVSFSLDNAQTFQVGVDLTIPGSLYM